MIAVAFGFGAGWLVWGKNSPVNTGEKIQKIWYWILPICGFALGAFISAYTLNSRDCWDEALVLIILFYGFWIPGLLLIPFIGNQVKPSPAWGWVASIIGFPAALVAGTFIVGGFVSLFIGGF